MSIYTNGVLFRKVFTLPVNLRWFPKFSFYQVQCTQVYVEVIDPFEVEFLLMVINMDIFAFLYMWSSNLTNAIC